MKLHIFKYTCNSCGSQFKAPEIGPDAYGEFLLRSSSGSLRYLNAMSNPVYDEVSKLVKTLPSSKDKSDIQLASIVRSAFGIACDPDEHGQVLHMDAKPVCPSCENQNITYWEATEPAEYVDETVEPVTHNKWGELSEKQKVETLLKITDKN